MLALCMPAMGAGPGSGDPPSAIERPKPESRDPSSSAVYDKSLLEESSPSAAKRFLEDKALQEKLLAEDPARFERLFLAATQAREMQELLSLHSGDIGALREALGSRADMPLAGDPKALLEWAKKYVLRIDLKVLDKALYGWEHLPASHHTWLAGKNITAESWVGMSFPQRQALMNEWAGGIYDQIMAMVPKTQAELDRMGRLHWEVWEYLTRDQGARVSMRVSEAQATVKGIVEAEAALARVNDPKLKEELDKAKSAASLESSLSSISAIFDNLRARNVEVPAAVQAAVRAERPPTAEEQLSETDRALVSKMLGPVLLREVQGTTGGDRVSGFYADAAKNPLKVSVGDTGPNFAYYWKGEIVFSEKTVQEFMKTYQVLAKEDTKLQDGTFVPKGGVLRTGISADDLKRDKGPLLQALAWELAACFVHEGTHHMQDAWATENKVPHWYVQRHETETLTLHALFVLEKRARNPGYAKFQDSRVSVSQRVQADLERGKAFDENPFLFRRDGLRIFRGVPSEESAAYSAARTPSGSGAAAAEARRAYLSYAERQNAIDKLVDERLAALQTGRVSPVPPGASRASGIMEVPIPLPEAKRVQLPQAAARLAPLPKVQRAKPRPPGVSGVRLAPKDPLSVPEEE